METGKQALLGNRSIEPTEVAGFNQFFDDLPGTEARRYGAGLDVRLGEALYAGGRRIKARFGSSFFFPYWRRTLRSRGMERRALPRLPVLGAFA